MSSTLPSPFTSASPFPSTLSCLSFVRAAVLATQGALSTFEFGKLAEEIRR